MSKIISKEQIKEALDKSIDGVSGVPGYMERFAREIEREVLETVCEKIIMDFCETTCEADEEIEKLESGTEAVISDLRAELAKADEKIAILESDCQFFNDQYLAAYAQAKALENRIDSGMRVYVRKGVFGNKFSTDKPEKFNATLIFDKGANDG